MDTEPEKLCFFFTENYPERRYHLVYEAGFSGYHLYDYFRERDIDIIVTPPNRIYTDYSKVKTDKTDSRKLAFHLSRNLLRQVVVA